MTNPLKSSTAENVALLLARVPLGLYFVLAGYDKIANVGVKKFAAGASGMTPSYVPPALGDAYLHALPYVEVVAGVMLVLGLFGRVGATLVFLMLVSFMLALSTFKDAQAPGRPFHSNLLFIGLAAVLATVGTGAFSLDRLLFRGKPAGAK